MPRKKKEELGFDGPSKSLTPEVLLTFMQGLQESANLAADAQSVAKDIVTEAKQNYGIAPAILRKAFKAYSDPQAYREESEALEELLSKINI